MKQQGLSRRNSTKDMIELLTMVFPLPNHISLTEKNNTNWDLTTFARFEATKTGDEVQDIGEFRPAIIQNTSDI